MTREEKNNEIQVIVDTIQSSANFYLADISGLTVEKNNALRRICNKKQIKLRVVKNTLLKKALLQIDGAQYEGLFEKLHGSTALMLSESINEPAKVVKAFAEKSGMPTVKAAYIDGSTYVGGPEIVNQLAQLKSKEELLGEIIGLLQSPAKNVISALKSSGGKIAGIVKTLSER